MSINVESVRTQGQGFPNIRNQFIIIAVLYLSAITSASGGLEFFDWERAAGFRRHDDSFKHH